MKMALKEDKCFFFFFVVCFPFSLSLFFFLPEGGIGQDGKVVGTPDKPRDSNTVRLNFSSSSHVAFVARS